MVMLGAGSAAIAAGAAPAILPVATPRGSTVEGSTTAVAWAASDDLIELEGNQGGGTRESAFVEDRRSTIPAGVEGRSVDSSSRSPPPPCLAALRGRLRVGVAETLPTPVARVGVVEPRAFEFAYPMSSSSGRFVGRGRSAAIPRSKTSLPRDSRPAGRVISPRSETSGITGSWKDPETERWDGDPASIGAPPRGSARGAGDLAGDRFGDGDGGGRWRVVVWVWV
jgi:hypothetical protein